MDTLNRDDQQPLAAQLREIILGQIQSGKLAVGGRTPSERELCTMYGVSRTTARNALLELEQLGYVTRNTGSGTYVRALATSQSRSEGSTGTIGFFLCRHHYPVASFREDYFYFGVMEGIQEELGAGNRHLLFHQLSGTESERLVIKDIAGKVDGILLAEAQSDDLIGGILSTGLPLVLINPSVDRLKFGLNTVAIDNRAGAYLAVHHLVELGHRSIGCIRGPIDSAPAAERFGGYCHALEEVGLSPRNTWTKTVADWTAEEGSKAIQSLLALAPELTAVFCASDTIAVGALAGLAPLRRVPDEMSVVGFDDISIASHSSPPLTTVRSPISELGKAGCRLLESARSNRKFPTATILFTPELKVRASTKRL